MPIFEYTCEKCESEFELLVRGTERPVCPTCGSQKLEKLLSVPAAHSKSGGSLPMRDLPQAGMCGRPQCGTGGCQGLG